MNISNSKKTFRISRNLAHKQRGVSIVQVMFGILISSIFVYQAVVMYQDSMKKARIDTAVQELIAIVSTAQRMYGYTNLYGQVTTAIAVQGGVVPESRRIPGTDTAQNNYNGAITFDPQTITSANDSLNISFANVRGGDCQQLVQSTENVARKISVDGTVVKEADQNINLAILATACDKSPKVQVSWVVARG